jgi:two-component sensor histidine kinase
MRVPADNTLELRLAVLTLGPWLGWVSLGAVIADLALDPRSHHREALVALILVAATANAAAMPVPWRDWHARLRGRLLLDLWSAALIAFVASLAVTGGASYSLLLFLTAPYIALIHTGIRRFVWLTVNGSVCVLVSSLSGVPAGATALRLSLVAAVVAAALVLARTIVLELAARRSAEVLAIEANHRIKNDLQTAADLLLLARPADGDPRPFDETAARLRSIAALHRLLAESREPTVDAGKLLASIAGSAPVPVAVEAAHVELDSPTAQKLGLVANELIVNALHHGAGPIRVSLGGERQYVLRVDDGGTVHEADGGLGLQLVKQIAEHGLGGRFELQSRPGGGTRAEVVFPRSAA